MTSSGALDLTTLRPRLPSPLRAAEDERFARHGVRLLLKRDDLIHPEGPRNKPTGVSRADLGLYFRRQPGTPWLKVGIWAWSPILPSCVICFFVAARCRTTRRLCKRTNVIYGSERHARA